MKSLLKILAVIFVAFLIIRFCKANFSDMTENEMYISTTDDHVKIELTEENTDSDSPQHIAYLYVNDEVYEGIYTMFVSNTFKKELWLSINDYEMYHEGIEDNSGSWLHGNFRVKRNKIVIQDTRDPLTRRSIFYDNNTFIKRTLWSTWGKKAAIIIGVLFVIWLLKDLPKMLMDKEMRQMFKDDFKESAKEYVNDVAEEVKDLLQ